MKRWRMKPQHYVIAIAISFLIAAINFMGLVLGDDIPGRLIVGATWSVVGIGWSSRYYYVKLKAREREVRDLRENLLAQARDTAAQQERNRLARELHDSIKQQIFSINMSAAAVQARWDADPQGARQALGDVRRSAQEAMAEMNALLQQLSPAPLEKVGLVQALRDQCEALGYRTDAEVTVEFGEFPTDDRLPTGAQESVFRIAQEAFSNVARHARANQVHLYMGQRDVDAPLTLEIQDDGQGFEVGGVGGGMGLDNIRQRVQALGGDLTIVSAPGEGTMLRVIIPLLEPTVSQGDLPMYSQDHTLNKTFLVGLGGGLALIAALFYPLYVLLPGGHIDGWMSGLGTLSFVSEVVAMLLAVVTGFLAARWAKADTRQGGILFGALAGGVAGAILYFGIGGAAAGVIGNDLLLQHGLAPAAGGADMIRMLAESLVRIVWWSHGAFWVMLLVGTGLGAVGGLLAPPATESSDRFDLRLAATLILTGGTFVSTFAFAFAVAVLSLLVPAIHDAVVKHGLSLETALAVEGVSFWLVGTPMAFYLTMLVALYFLLRVEIRQDPARLNVAHATAAVFSLLSFGIPAYLLIVNPRLARPTSVLGMAVMAAIASSLVLGGLYLVLFFKARRRRQALGLDRPHIARTVAVVGALLSLGVISWAINLPSFLTILIGLVVIIADLVFVVILRRYPGPPLSDSATLARRRLAMSQSINGGLGIVVAMIVPSMATISVFISIAMIVARFIPVLGSYDMSEPLHVPDSTLAELVRDAYLTQARAFLISFVGAAVSIGLPMLVISGIIAIIQRRSVQDVEIER